MIQTILQLYTEREKLNKKKTIQIPIFINKSKNLPDVNRLIELLAIEMEVKWGQNLNGSFTICSIELLSKLMEINIVIAVDFNELHSTLKITHNIFFFSIHTLEMESNIKKDLL